MLVKIYKCDQCGIEEKGPMNWFSLSTNKDTISIHKWPHNVNTSMHLCGLPCVFKKISELNTAI